MSIAKSLRVFFDPALKVFVSLHEMLAFQLALGCRFSDEINVLKNSVVEFTIISLLSDPALNDLSIA